MKNIKTIPTTQIRCPLCGKGRLCDALKETRLLAFDLGTNAEINMQNIIIIKCPKCGGTPAIKFF